MAWLRQAGRVPAHQVRVSVFGGLGAEILAQPPCRTEVYNDRNRDVFNFMACLRDHSEEMVRRARYTPYHEAEYQHCWDLLQSGHGDKLDRAHAFGVCSNMGHVGRDPLQIERTSFGVVAQSHGQTAGWARIDQVYGAVARRLRAVQCFCRDWGWVLNRFDSEQTFFSIDPPYLGYRLYSLSMSEQDHSRLLGRVQALRGRAMIFHSPHEMYLHELRGWRRIDVNFTSAMGTVTRGKPKPRHSECVWTNY
jgi:site-specific DNA-adenine methylase